MSAVGMGQTSLMRAKMKTKSPKKAAPGVESDLRRTVATIQAQLRKGPIAIPTKSETERRSTRFLLRTGAAFVTSKRQLAAME